MADNNDKPQLDERALAKLLEAAYVVQEHNRKQPAARRREQYEAPVARAKRLTPATERADLLAKEPVRTDAAPAPPAPWLVPPDHSAALAKIVETQRELQMRRSELAEPISLIAQRVVEIVRAGGAAIGIVQGETITYPAKAGHMTPSGTQFPLEKALSTACLRTGHTVRCDDVDAEFLVDADECHRRGIQSMIAVPVFREGQVAGALEIYYPGKRGFTEQDVHSAQLMAGLVGDALAREEEKNWKKSLASERAVMLEALEKLKPNLAALVDVSPGKNGADAPVSSEPSAVIAVCRKCGHELPEEEQFCGKCGTPRSGVYEPPNMQSKVASLWQMQEAAQKGSVAANGAEPRADATHGFDDAQFEKLLADSLEKEMPALFQALDAHAENPSAEAEAASGHSVEAAELESEFSGEETGEEAGEGSEDANGESGEEQTTASTALVKTERTPDWTSAANAREFLEQLAGERSGGLAGFWRARRGDVYLALAVILVACVIRWGIWSNRPVSATGTATPAAGAAQQHRKPPDADLSLFDRLLINLGVAEAPEPTENKGNPRTEVWVDLHTALYYCPGSDLYGKTPKGKYTTQRDAQLDQFEPAYRKACD